MGVTDGTEDWGEEGCVVSLRTVGIARRIAFQVTVKELVIGLRPPVSSTRGALDWRLRSPTQEPI